MHDEPTKRARRRLTAVERVLNKVVVTPAGCWEYTGRRNDDGYGLVQADKKRQRVHRVVYEALVGPIPDGLEIDHLCRNRVCVNTRHLEVVEHAENLRRAWRTRPRRPRPEPRKPRTHCRRGHELTPENAVPRPGNRGPGCRTCKAASDRAAYIRRQAKRGFVTPD